MSDQPAGVSQGVINKEQASTSHSEDEQSKTAQSYKTKQGELIMAVKVSSPYRDYFDGQAFSISAENLTGPFDVLPKHHSFISLLIPCDLTIRTPDNEKGPIRIRITGGLIHVKADQVIVFLDV